MSDFIIDNDIVEKYPEIVLDGQNIAYNHGKQKAKELGCKGFFSYEGLKIAAESLYKNGYRASFILPYFWCKKSKIRHYDDAQDIVDSYNYKSGERRSVNSLLKDCNVSSFNSKGDARVLLAYAKELLKATKPIGAAASDKAPPSKDEVVKLDKLYREGYLSKERYLRLKQDLGS